MNKFLLAACLAAFTLEAADMSYTQQIQTWRQEREARLKADDGWLTITGLFWLHEGENSIGADPSNDIQLPADSAPANLGTIHLESGKATFHSSSQAVTLNGQAVQEAELHDDASGKPDALKTKALELLFIKRGERWAIRLRDQNSALRRDFTHLRWFPIDESWRVTAKFTAYPEPKQIAFDTVIGTKDTMESPGYVTFAYGGQQYQLQAAKEGPGPELYFVFRDLTSGRTTYGGARQLYTDAPKDGEVILDFNKAFNFPCAFNPYTTCPLAPPQNRLKVAVNAGEMLYIGKEGSPAGH